MARRRASRPNPAKIVGALLIAAALLIGISIVPAQQARFPGEVASHLRQAVGEGRPLLPFLCLLIGLIFFVRESFRLSARVSGILVGYLTGLVVLHLRSPSGRAFAAAARGVGGGYVGAVAASALRRWVGEPGAWVAVGVAVVGAALLISGRSLTQVLRAIALAGHRLGPPLGAWALRAAASAGQAAWDALGRTTRALAGWARASLAQRPLRPQTDPGASMGEPFPQGELAALVGAKEVVPAALVGGEERPHREPEDPAPARAPVEVEPGGARRRPRPVVEQELLPFPPAPHSGYSLPPLSLLDTDAAGKARGGAEAPEEVARNLERTLASFGVEAKVIRWETGPVVTRFELQPAPGVKVQRITSLQNDIALALAASSVRLEAPIPGKAAIGVELPNERPGLVHLGEMLASPELQRSASPLTVSIGKGIAGAPITADLQAMPHLLIAGATGAGKSVALNAMIATLLFRATPEQVRFLMIDPKRVELTNYNGIPHLLSPVVTDPREAAAKLRWAIQEMESRYALFAGEGVRNIQSFNAHHPDRPLAFIVIIIDELADLMMVAPKDFEEIICRLTQMTRAVGIHLVVATQRPSVDVITGLIKANIPSRIAFAVTSQVDSRTILDHPGAEKLLGRGDMLFAPIGATRPMRVQGSYISDADSQRLVECWRTQGQPEYVEELVQAGGEAGAEEGEGDDSLLAQAARLVVRAGYGSVSLLQRKMRIGYVRAARLIDQLEAKGIVGPTQGSSPREVRVGLDDLDRMFRSGRARSAQDAEWAEA